MNDKTYVAKILTKEMEIKFELKDMTKRPVVSQNNHDRYNCFEKNKKHLICGMKSSSHLKMDNDYFT